MKNTPRGAAIYCVTPTTETVAHAVAKGNQPQPVAAWELRLPPAPTSSDERDKRDERDERDSVEPAPLAEHDLPW